MQSNRFASLALASGVAVAAPWCDVAIAEELILVQPIRLYGFNGSGTAGSVGGRLKHFHCSHVPTDTLKECVVPVQVATRPLDPDKGECVIRVKDVIVLAKDTKQIKWKLEMTTKKEFLFLDDTGVEIDSNLDGGDGDTGNEVFSAQRLTDDGDEFVHIVLKRPTRVFPYTIRLWQNYTDDQGAPKKKKCAPLDPVIVNRD